MKRPNIDDFEDMDEYAEALEEYHDSVDYDYDQDRDDELTEGDA